MTHPLRPASPFQLELQKHLDARIRKQDDGGRRRQILVAVLQEWSEVGPAEAHMVQIAKRAKQSTATLYRLYPEPSDLFKDALSFGDSLFAEAMMRPFDHPNPLMRLTDMVENFAETLDEPLVQNLLVARILQRHITHSAENPSNLETLKQIHAHWFAILQAYVEQGFLLAKRPDILFRRLVGPIERKSLGTFFMSTKPYEPQGGWRAEAVKSVEAFFTIYGTPRFHDDRQTYNWNWSLDHG